MNRAELKAKAKEQIKGKIGILLVISLVIAALSALVTLVVGLIPYVGKVIAPIVVAPAFSLSLVRVMLGITAGTEPKVGDAFCGFDDYWSALKLHLLSGLYIFLWSLLLVIPGIIKTYAYSMSVYILAENKGKSARECIKESVAMTMGYKVDLFVLGLSFIGWGLLSCITFGIALIWVMPYMQATYANAYNLLKSKVVPGVEEASVAE
jgi:uncharacterized membrane protein